MALDLETREQLIDTVRRFVTERLRPLEAKVSEDDAIPAEVVLAPDGPAGTSETQDDSDFAARLKALSAEQEKQP